MEDNKIVFKYELRQYQKRALDEIDKYINDDKIHIVAAPGAGKTILALKLVFDFNQNTLILVPTIAIREQWVERMLKDFSNVEKEDISTDLKNLKRFNVVSYQALYEYKKPEIKKIIEENNIKTIVLDEAHHLRNAWWKVLSSLFEEVKNIKIVSLTATPPYDDDKNFGKYIELCGEIDAQINIPELVGQKNLCPHQDFIYLNVPTEEQNNQIDKYREKSLQIIKNFDTNVEFLKAISTHSFLIDYKNNIDLIIDNYDIVSVMLKYLKHNNIEFNKDLEEYYKSNSSMKIKDYETIFNYLIFSNDPEFEIIDNSIKDLKRELTSIGAINKDHRISLLYNEKIEGNIGESVGKLNSINEIVKHEYNNLGEELKMVITTDFIKDDYSDFEENELNQIGVMPIFNNITDNLKFHDVCVLTGTVVIIPANTVQSFKEICEKNNVKEKDYTISEIKQDFSFYRIGFKSNAMAVKVITELFEIEKIKVLIGTVALIGEGWDAPFVNTLIIASAISTYVTSNQIRGRAIRIDKTKLSKEANIWHLACLEKLGGSYVKGKDYIKIEKRFKSIEGLSLTENKIMSGIERFKVLENNSYSIENILASNKLMISNSNNRENIYNRWFESLKDYIPNNNVVLKSNKILKDRKLIYKTRNKNIGKIIIKTAVFAGIAMFAHVPMGIGAAGIALYDIIKAKKMISSLNYEKQALECISKTVIDILKEQNVLPFKAEYKLVKNNEKYEIKLLHADIRAQNIFIKCIEEAISKKCNSRYILIADDKVFNVPSYFDKKKETAEYFKKIYCKNNRCSKAEIIYSKNEIGKLEKLKLLLKQDEEKIDEEQELFDGNVDVAWLKSALEVDRM